MKGVAMLTGIEHGFDRANNRLYTRRLHDSSEGDNFVYDSVYRLVSWEREVPAASVGFPGGTSFDARQGFDLDGAHSRHRTTRATSGNQVPVPTVITVSDVHNYMAKKKGTGPQFTTWNQTFDLNGNKTAFTDQGAHPTYKYDFLNRLRVIQQGTQKVEFDYDAEGKRVRTKVTGLSGYPATTEFVHDGDHVLEELDGSGVCLRRFYYGDNLDELVAYENLSFYPGPGFYFYEQDSMRNVLAIHDLAGNVVERYNYGAFGSPFFETSLNVPKNVSYSDYGNPYLFKGLRYETFYDALYYMRARFLDCNDGGFMQRDPIGAWGDKANAGNPKAYCGGNPINSWDPLGMNAWDVNDLPGSEDGTGQCPCSAWDCSCTCCPHGNGGGGTPPATNPAPKGGGYKGPTGPPPGGGATPPTPNPPGPAGPPDVRGNDPELPLTNPDGTPNPNHPANNPFAGQSVGGFPEGHQSPSSMEQRADELNWWFDNDPAMAPLRDFAAEPGFRGHDVVNALGTAVIATSIGYVGLDRAAVSGAFNSNRYLRIGEGRWGKDMVPRRISIGNGPPSRWNHWRFP